MGKKNKKATPIQGKKDRSILRGIIPLKKLFGRLPMFRPGHSHTPKKGKGVAYDRKKDDRAWRKDT